MGEKLFTVYVGGVEVSDFLFTSYESALATAEEWIADGYDDVSIEDVTNGYENATIVYEG